MGDLVDFITVPKQEHIFYKITSGSIRFQVKGPRNAAIGLAVKPDGGEHALWLVLGRGTHSTISKGVKQVHSVQTPGILSAHEFREFWMQWHDDLITIGRDYATDPFMAYQDKTANLKYIAFTVYENDDCVVQWRFEVPPFREHIKLKSVFNGVVQWLPADSQLPDGALIGGFEKEALYIIRSPHNGSLTPGKFVPSHGVGYISWGGTMHEKTELEVLCGYDCVWVPCSNGRVPSGAVEAGYSEGTDRETLYVGRARFNEHIIPGKVQPSHHVCYIPYDEREIAMKQYEILVVPHSNLQFANPLFIYDHGMRLI